jgi:uncharacterized protein YjiS (DUF1127 family)
MRFVHGRGGPDRLQNRQVPVYLRGIERHGEGRRVPGGDVRNKGGPQVSEVKVMSLYSIATQVRSSLERYRSYRRAVRELSALDDRQLCDIGLVRSRIEEAARGAAH